MAGPEDIDSLKSEDIVVKGKVDAPDPKNEPPAPPAGKTDPPAPPAGKTDPPKPADPPAPAPKKPEAGSKPGLSKREPAGKTDPPKPADPPVPAAGKTDPPKPADPPAPAAGKTDPPKPEPEPEPEAEFDWEAFSEDVGLELTNDEDLTDALKELAEYRALSPGLKKAIEIERKKGDVGAYFRSVANDPAKLSDGDALWEQYVAENPKRASDNPKFARLDFERRLEKEYSLLQEYEKLSAEEQEEFLTEHKAEIAYLQEKRKFDADSARASLQEKRKDATFFAPDGKPQLTEEQLKANYRKHAESTKKAVEEFDVVSIPLGDDFEFNVGITDSNKKQVMAWMRDPSVFLNEIGFQDGKLDYDTMLGWMSLIADIKYGDFGARLRQSIIDNKDIQTLEKTIDAPNAGKKDPAPPPEPEGDEWSQVGAAFEKKRKEGRR